MNITNDKVTDYINGFYRPVSLSMEKLRQEAEEHKVPIILKETETFLLNLIKMKRPARILEVGTAVGYSAMCFASAYEDCFIVSIEAKEEMYQTAQYNIEKMGFSDRIKVRLGDGADVMKTLHEEQCEGFDMIFIDASKSHYKEFWTGAIKLCKDQGIIISDNVLMKARTVSDEYDLSGKYKTNIRNMREYVNYIHELDYCSTSVVAIGDGLSLSVVTQ